MVEADLPHPGHDQHLCYLANLGFQESNSKEYVGLVKDAKFVCKNCGRVAASEENLCAPMSLEDFDES